MQPLFSCLGCETLKGPLFRILFNVAYKLMKHAESSEFIVLVRYDCAIILLVVIKNTLNLKVVKDLL